MSDGSPLDRDEELEAFARRLRQRFWVKFFLVAILVAIPLWLTSRALRMGLTTEKIAKNAAQQAIAGSTGVTAVELTRALRSPRTTQEESFREAVVTVSGAGRAATGLEVAAAAGSFLEERLAPIETEQGDLALAIAQRPTRADAEALASNLGREISAVRSELATSRAEASVQAQAISGLSQSAASLAQELESVKMRLSRLERTFGQRWYFAVVTQAQSRWNNIPGTDLLLKPGKTPVGSESRLLGFEIAESSDTSRRVFGPSTVIVGRDYAFESAGCSYSFSARILEPSHEVFNNTVVTISRVCDVEMP